MYDRSDIISWGLHWNNKRWVLQLESSYTVGRSLILPLVAHGHGYYTYVVYNINKFKL